MIVTELGWGYSMMSGIAWFFFDTCGTHWQWPSLTEIMNIKKIQLFIEFPPICLSNLNLLNTENQWKW
jgi:hypothetical protein